MKIETGVMVMKNGKAWGIVYQDGHCTSYGWKDAETASIHNPAFCKEPTDLVYAGSPYEKELSTAKIVAVKRTTTVEIIN